MVELSCFSTAEITQGLPKGPWVRFADAFAAIQQCDEFLKAIEEHKKAERPSNKNPFRACRTADSRLYSMADLVKGEGRP